MSRILIIGGSGQVGSRLCSRFAPNEVLSPSHAELDLTQEDQLRHFLRKETFQTIIIPGGMTSPAQCALNPESAVRANSLGPEIVAEEARGAHIIYFSTDFVFDGKTGPYDLEAIPNPINHYGKTKRDGELRIQKGKWTVIRTSHIYSRDTGSNFFMFVVRNLMQGKPVHAYQDQTSTPTEADSLVEATVRIVQEGVEGVIHLSGKETCSRYEFATEVSTLLGIPGVSPIPCPGEDKPKKVGLRSHLPSWREGIREHITRIKESGLPKVQT